MIWGAARSEFLLVVVLLTGCVQTGPVAQWRQPVDPRPQIVTSERAYVEAPTPAKFLDPPLVVTGYGSLASKPVGQKADSAICASMASGPSSP